MNIYNNELNRDNCSCGQREEEEKAKKERKNRDE